MEINKKMEKLKYLLNTDLFNPTKKFQITLKESMYLTINRMKELFQNDIINNSMWLGEENEEMWEYMLESLGHIGAFDFALGSSITDHMIAGSALFEHGDKLQKQIYYNEIIKMEEVYSFCCTEIGRGTDIYNIGTIVIYNKKNNNFILQTPTNDACKFWIGNALYSAKYGMVLAKLIIDDKNMGHHWFRVQLRKNKNDILEDGIKIIECDPKGGIHSNQVAGIRFNNVILPIESLMKKYSYIENGTYKSILKNNHERFIMSMSTFIQERLLPLVASYRIAEASVYITYKFSNYRIIANNQQLINNILFQNRLKFIIGNVIFLNYLQKSIIYNVKINFKKNRSLSHIYSALGKCISTWIGLDTIRKCREMCGSQGFHHYNQIITYLQDFEINVTFAGDNSVMAYQVANYILKKKKYTHQEAIDTCFKFALDISDCPIWVNKIIQFVYLRKNIDIDIESIDIHKLALQLNPLNEIISAPIVSDNYIDFFTSKL